MPGQGGSVYDSIARNIEADSLDFEEETTTFIPDDLHDVARRSLDSDKIIFTRSGAYHLIESRLDA